jgi:hypothetical protein
MKKLKFLFPLILIIISCIYSYLWLITAEQIKKNINQEVEEARNLGILVDIDDFKYSTFPFAVTVKMHNTTLTLHNSINHKAYLVNMPDIVLSCDILVTKCTFGIESNSRIKILEKESKNFLYEVNFLNGINTDLHFTKSLLMAHFLAKGVSVESLTKSLNFAAPEITLYDMQTNQLASTIKHLAFSKIAENTQINSSAQLMSMKFGVEIRNTTDSTFYLAHAFNALDMASEIEILTNQNDKSDISKEIKINKLRVNFDQANFETHGKFKIDEDSTLQEVDLSVAIKNYTDLFEKFTHVTSSAQSIERQKHATLLQQIVEQVTGKPYTTNVADFKIFSQPNNPDNLIIGNSSMNDIMQSILTYYQKKKS